MKISENICNLMLMPAPYSEAQVCQILHVLLRWGSGNVPLLFLNILIGWTYNLNKTKQYLNPQHIDQLVLDMYFKHIFNAWHWFVWWILSDQSFCNYICFDKVQEKEPFTNVYLKIRCYEFLWYLFTLS